MRTVVCVFCFLMLFSASIVAQPAEFEPCAIDTGFGNPWAIIGCDLDGDGNLEVVGSDANTSLYWWTFNPVQGSFTQHVLNDGYTGCRFIDMEDVDLDGDPDLLTSSYTEEHLDLFYNNSGSFERYILEDNIDGAKEVLVFDVDHDGDQDVIGFGQTNVLSFWYERVNQYLYERHTIGYINGIMGAAHCDLNYDSYEDILCSAFSEGVFLWVNDTEGDFDSTEVDPSLNYGQSIISADMNDDGLLDIVATTQRGVCVTVYLQMGILMFEQHDVLEGYSVYQVKAADMNSDGITDLVIATNSGIYWLENDGSPDFMLHTVYEGLARNAFPCDLDNDGDVDILGTFPTLDQFMWFENLMMTSAPENDGTGSTHPDQFRILQVYPNPFNHQVTVEYQSPSVQIVQLYLYNSLGQVVYSTTPVHLSIGDQRMRLSFGDYSSGVYFLQMRLENQVMASQRLILLK